MDVVEEQVALNPEAREGDPDFGKTVTRRVGRWFPKGTLGMTELETALFAGEKGALVGPVETGGAYYVAKLEDKKAGRVHTFEEEAVQGKIRRTS